ncbi:hypothetical protein MVEN_01657000 [Mycena venus]|uniref:DUF6535 domain-containing protein n=1 Tax=Mycena venus TaxID=2733690 RepID=A0A8H6XR45_9AGAR|nr:hypothetical protein MVEN_01657000 [Mycena venus]
MLVLDGRSTGKPMGPIDEYLRRFGSQIKSLSPFYWTDDSMCGLSPEGTRALEVHILAFTPRLLDLTLIAQDPETITATLLLLPSACLTTLEVRVYLPGSSPPSRIGPRLTRSWLHKSSVCCDDCRLATTMDSTRHESNEASSAKLWSVYISEAEKYDKALVESWRSDMDGLLIFAGLFSGSLTAFLIESYKSLAPESTNMTVLLLAQISQQLAGGGNGTAVVTSPPVVFVPATSALICNTLWFISLGLSLSCALVATLLEQWARNFIHRADICSAPVIRARMISFLYFGLKRFNMHTMVEIVPLLLHAALLFFFGGLVAFLAPINRQMMFLSAALLGLIVACYLVITILPLIYLDCPYHTPVSSALWRLFGLLRAAYGLMRCRLVDDKSVTSAFHTMVAAISLHAMESSDERNLRDRRALIWTLKSLADENALEPLVESIPDLLWGPHGRRYHYDKSVMQLVTNPDVRLSARIEDLLLSCDSGLLTYDAMIRRQILCLKALWCIASLIDHAASRKVANDVFDLSLTGPVPFSENIGVNHYAVSTRALTRWNIFCSMRGQVLETLRYIGKCQDIVGTERVPDLAPALSCIDRLQVQESFFVPYWRIEGLDDAKMNIPIGSQATSLWLERVFYCLQSFRHDTPYLIFFDYLEHATNLDRLPYAYEETRSLFQLPDRPPSTLVRSRLEWILKEIVNKNLHMLRAKPTIHWIDEVLATLASFWRVTEDDLPTVPVPNPILQYITQRESDTAISHLVLNIDCNTLWSCMATSITDDSWGMWADLSNSLTALWHLSSLTLKSAELSSENIFPEPRILESVLSSAVAINAPSSSVVAILKATLLNSLFHFKDRGVQIESEEIYQTLYLRVFPQDSANEHADNRQVWDHEWYNRRETMENRRQEAYISLLAEFLESCSSHHLPYNARETILLLDHPLLTAFRKVHAQKSVQLRFANGLRSVFQSPHQKAEVLETLANLRVFSLLIGANETENQSTWLNDSEACEVIQETLTHFLSASSLSLSPGVAHKLREIAVKITDLARGDFGQNGD